MDDKQAKAFGIFCKYAIAKEEYEKGNIGKSMGLLSEIKDDLDDKI